MNSILLLLLATTILNACQVEREENNLFAGPFVNINSLPDIDGQNNMSYRVSGRCQELGGAVELTLTDVNSTQVAPQESPTCTMRGDWMAEVDTSSLAEGEIVIAVSHQDSNGNLYDASRQVFKDLSPLSFTIEELGNILVGEAANYRLHGTCSEEGREISLELTDAQENPQSVSPGATINCLEGMWEVELDTTGLQDGDITISAVHRDAGGRPFYVDERIQKDLLAPTVTVDSYDNILVNSQGRYTLQGDCSEDRQLVDVELSNTMGTPNLTIPNLVARCSEGRWQAEFNTRRLQDGEISIVVNHRDLTGNSLQLERDISKDVQAPSISIDSPNNIFSSSQNTYGVDGECSEDGRAVGVTFEDQSTQTLSSSSTCSGGTWQVENFNLSSLADGAITIRITQSDTLGNSKEQSVQVYKSSSDLQVTIDSTPAVNISNHNSYVLSGTCTPDGGNLTVSVGGRAPIMSPSCSNGVWSANFNLQLLNDSNTIEITADYSDNGGIESAPQVSAMVIKDIVVPTISIGDPPAIDRITDSSTQLSGDCSEDGQLVEVSIAGSNNNTVESQVYCANTSWMVVVDVSTLTDASLEITATHADLADNSATATTTANRDNSIIITIADPPNIIAQNELSYGLSGTCSEEGAEVTVSVDTVGPSTQPTCTQFAWTVSGVVVDSLADGAVQVTVLHGSVSVTADIHKGCISLEESGAVTDPIVVCNYNGLMAINNARHKYYILGQDIDASASWSENESSASCTAYDGTTIASSTPCSGMPPIGRFTGGLDGDGYQITNLYMNASLEGMGLFADLANQAMVRNLHLQGVRINNTLAMDEFPVVGGLAGFVGPSVVVDNCSVQGRVSGNNDVGGVIGYTNGRLSNSYANVIAEGKFVGTLVGYNNGGMIISSYGRGTVVGEGSSDGAAGGLVGNMDNNAFVRNSYANVQVSGANSQGGLVGFLAESTIGYSYGRSTITGSGGGVIGFIDVDLGSYTLEQIFWNTGATTQTDAIGNNTTLLITSGLNMAAMKSACPTGSTNIICNLGSGMSFAAMTFPKVKKCLDCSQSSTTYGSELVGGQ